MTEFVIADDMETDPKSKKAKFATSTFHDDPDFDTMPNAEAVYHRLIHDALEGNFAKKFTLINALLIYALLFVVLLIVLTILGSLYELHTIKFLGFKDYPLLALEGGLSILLCIFLIEALKFFLDFFRAAYKGKAKRVLIN